MNKLKKPVSLLLTLLLLLSVAAAAPVSVSADDATVYTEGNYQYTVSKKKATIVKYIGHAKKVVVPSTLGGYPVESIGCMDPDLISSYDETYHYSDSYGRSPDIRNKGAFFNNQTIRSVTIPCSIKTIGYFAFRGCANLSELEICNGVEKIWVHAFKECPKLKVLELPESIKFVARDAFDGGYIYTDNTPAIIEDGVTDLTLNTDFDFRYINLPYCSVKRLTISAGSKRIPEEAFKNFYSLEEVSIANTVQVIGARAFYFLYYWGSSGLAVTSPLRQVRIPPSVEYIGDEAFRRCNGLEAVELHKGLKSIGSYAFANCYSLNYIILPNNLQSLGKGAFLSCSSLTSIDLPGSIGTIRKLTFLDSGVQNVTIYNGITTIEKGAFSIYSDEWFADPSYYEDEGGGFISDNPVFSLFGGPAYSPYPTETKIQTVRCPSSLIDIQGTLAFGPRNVTLTSPKSASAEYYANNQGYDWAKDENPIKYKDEDELAAESGGGPLSDLNTLIGIAGGYDAIADYIGADLNLEIPSSLEGSPVKNIAVGAFRNLDIKSIGFPDSIENIGSWAFSGCKKLGEATLKAGVQELGEYAFENCSNLTDVELPESVTTLGDSVFSGCKKLQEINLPDGLTSLGKAAFNECSSLRSIELPDSFTSISYGLFRNCTSLADVDLPNNLSNIRDIAFSSCKSLSELEIPDTLKSVKDSVFSDCINLDDIELPDGLTELGDSVFSGCDGLKNIELPDTVTSLGDSAFENCKNLKNIELSDSMTSIGAYTFNNCTSLDNVEIPEGITSIGERAFSYCYGLSNITIPESVNSIRIDAFSGCNNLVISGYSGSYAEEFAEGLNIPFIAYSASGAKATLDSYSVPDNFENIVVSNTFYDNPVTKIGDDVFKDFTTMRNIELPATITDIGARTFSGCSELQYINLPVGIKTIDASAFLNCTNLTNLVVPSGADSLGENAFKGCTNLEEAYIWGRGTAVGSDAFKNCDDDITIYAYDSSPADTYASDNDVDFVPLLNTNKGIGYEDIPLTDTQTAVNDGNTFGLNQETYGNIEFLGIQQKNDQGCGIRFVGVINEGIVAEATRSHDVDDYGFVVAKCSKSSTSTTSEDNIKTITVGSSNALTLSCKNTSNQICGAYGVYNADTKYKYVTLAVNNVNPEQGLVARFYVKTKSGRVYYANYGTEHTGCVTDYNRIAAMSGGDNSVLIRDEWNSMSTFSDN
ncbi:MAG: leucine-rich repeat domain-containing protein [Ruminococcus sp.]|nr:leucine-rich repeat domain-containing protein [Ruminococcus sp.]